VLIRFDGSSLRRTQWYEYASRFFFGGVITVLTGIIAHQWGPAIGGLFLAFPAIFPASASLIDKHQREKNERAGVSGTIRGRKAAAVDAAGATMGAVGLAIFAATVWKLMPHSALWAALVIGTAAWATTVVAVWLIRKRGIHVIRSWWLRSEIRHSR
jgi:hypothetical protein